MTKTQEWIIKYLKGKGFTSPTEIGRAYGREKYQGWYGFTGYHSSWASPRCKKLVEMGLLERNDRGHYRLRHNE